MLNETDMWTAVRTRDAAQDGRFVYGVATTGIYCRPSCASRQPRRENVRFFADVEAAEAAGFRACRRCRGADLLAATVAELCRQIDADADTPLPLAELARRAGYGAYHLHRRFKALTGLTPRAYRDAARLRLLKERLRDGSSTTDAIHAAGYGSGSRVYESADAQLGLTPGQYRAGGSGAVIAHAGFDTAFGRMMIGATERGICFAEFGEDDDALLTKLASEFPHARLVPAGDGPQLRLWAGLIAAYLDDLRSAPLLPLDPQGTAFQRLVWDALRAIPPGETRSYAELAAAIGRPSSSRAVAAACAANRLAVLIPCHRVLRGDGTLSGYRWTPARKRKILDGEKELAGG